MGIIRFGSRVDVFVPPTARGDRERVGETTVAGVTVLGDASGGLMAGDDRQPVCGRTVVQLPNGFTLANLFFGVFAIVAASRGDLSRAGAYIVFGGIADALDGRVARATRTGSRFGEELDSLVDAISFGLAPAMIMYFAVLNQSGWDWIFCFIYTMCAVIRLARFNIEQAGRAKTLLQRASEPGGGPHAGDLLLVQPDAALPGDRARGPAVAPVLRYLMVGLAFLMISNVKYAAVPTIGYRSLREMFGSLVVVAAVVGVIFLPRQFFFPALLAYVVWGVVRTFFVGLLAKLPGAEYEDATLLETPADETNVREDGAGARRRRRRRRVRGARHQPPQNPMEDPRA